MNRIEDSMNVPIETDVTAVLLPVASLVANDYNPNEMTTEQMAELVAEVRHLGRLPKPVIVRPNGAGYVIVDGEHGWRAAQTVGLTDVPCEIVEVDEFEARRQTFKRNQHGTHNPLRLGQMFQQMMADRSLSQRALAAEIEVSEGTVRNALVYAEAATLRNGYAAAPREAPPVETLSVRQVRAYVKLPPGIGHLWLDCGADLAALFGQSDLDGIDRALKGDHIRHSFDYSWLETKGLIPYVHGNKYAGFTRAIKQMREWANWESRYCRHGLTIDMVRPYTEHYFRHAWAVREPFLMDRALSLVLNPDTRPPSFRLTPTEFAATLQPPDSDVEGDSGEKFYERLQLTVVTKTGYLPQTSFDVQHKLLRAEVEATAPDYIRASGLRLEMKAALWNASLEWDDSGQAVTPEDLETAKRALASLSTLNRQHDESPDEAVKRHLHAHLRRTRLVEAHSLLTELEMANALARQLALYDEDKDRAAILRVVETLMRLTKGELFAFHTYMQGAEFLRHWQDALRELAANVTT
jgi:ParB/RepB/Spo0J family partition protein